MAKIPGITAILTTTGYSAAHSHSSQHPDKTRETVLVGVVAGGEEVAWGFCPAVPLGLEAYPESFDPAGAAEAIGQQAAPVLVGQELTSFGPLANAVEALRETVTVTWQETPVPHQDNGLSRRALLTGRLDAEAEVAARTVEETFERPLHPAVRYGLSQALLSAAALAQGVTTAEVMASEYELPPPTAPASLFSTVGTGESTAIACAHRVAGLGIDWPGDDPEEELGRNNGRLQGYLRQLTRYLARTAGDEYRPAIHLDVGGGLGALYDHNAGRLLGACYGLERVGEPYPLYLADPVVMDNRDEQVEKMAELKKFVTMRDLSLRLAAGAWIDSPADALAFVEAEAADLLRLDAVRLGGVQRTVETALAARERGAGVLIESHGDPAIAQIALALRPDFLSTGTQYEDGRGIAAFHNEMARTLSWLDAGH